MSESTTNPIVTIEDGQLQGTTGVNLDGEEFLQFLGIPYGQPPVNELRFKPPLPAKPWEGVRDATKAGNSALAADSFVGRFEMSEDCLFLNVYTKKLPTGGSKLRPVMVFIHGGSLTMGSGRPEMHGPKYFMIKDVVLVVINYRLGALGFLSVTGTDVTGNMGLKDQNLALKWVRRNVKKFNGDPDNVTIFGISAGSASVHGHILSPLSKGLFHKAILQSGSTLNPWFWGSKNNARQLVEQLGKTASTEQEALEILKQASGEDILQAQLKMLDVLYSSFQRPFGAVVEDPNETAYFEKHPREIMGEGVYNKVPMIVGFTDTEGMLIDILPLIHPRVPKYETQDSVPYELNAPKGSAKNQEILGIFERLYPDSRKGRYDAFTDSAFLAGIAESVMSQLDTSIKPIYFYRMSVATQLNGVKALTQKQNEPGACHGDDMGYFWHTPRSLEFERGSPEDKAMRAFLELWTNFAQFGDPTPKTNTLNVTWPPVEDKDRLTVLDIGQELKVTELPEQNRVQTWLDMYREWYQLGQPIVTIEEGRLSDTNLDGGKGMQDNPIVTIEEGKLQGTVGTNLDGGQILQFFAIPYAQPPVNELRFKPPLPATPWQGLRDATKPGPACISRDDFTGQIVGSEDCLHLNVYTRELPNPDYSKLKPVMVYIHGGGLKFGCNRPGLYGPDFLLLKDIVLVTINYRLGVLGFLSIQGTEISGNMGLKDQNLALKWVQRNIKYFNGDPSNVTIFGESAGSASVHAHVLSPASRGLFHKAILQSGCVFNHWFWGTKNRGKELAKHLGRDVSSELEALEVLRQASGLKLFAAQEKIPDILYASFQRPFGAVIEEGIEGAFFTETPREIARRGDYNQVPLMVGYTDTEGLLHDFMNMIGFKMPPYEMEDMIPFELGLSKGSDDSKRIAAILESLYFDQETKKNPYDKFTDCWFLAGIIEALVAHLETSPHPIYLYRMSINTQLNQFKRLMRRLDEPGVSHADDLGYLWHTDITPEIKPGSLEDQFMRLFVDKWTNFAEYGNPTETLNISWPPLSSKERLTLLDIGKQLTVKDDLPERERIQVWSDIYSQHGAK